MKSFLTIIAGLLVASTSFAGHIGYVRLRGIVPAYTSLSATTLAAAGSLDLIGGETNKKVASISEENNTYKGYKVFLTSKNSGKLASRFSRRNMVPYSAKYSGMDVTLSTTPQLISSVDRQYRVVHVHKDLTVSIPSSHPNDRMAGKYGDILKFVIKAN